MKNNCTIIVHIEDCECKGVYRLVPPLTNQETFEAIPDVEILHMDEFSDCTIEQYLDDCKRFSGLSSQWLPQ